MMKKKETEDRETAGHINTCSAAFFYLAILNYTGSKAACFSLINTAIIIKMEK